MKLRDEVTLAWMTSLFCSPLSKIHDLPVMMESNHFSASLEIIRSRISQILINGLCRKSSALGKCMKLLWWCLLGCWPKVMAETSHILSGQMLLPRQDTNPRTVNQRDQWTRAIFTRVWKDFRIQERMFKMKTTQEANSLDKLTKPVPK